MRKQDLIDELASLVDNIENTVEELNKTKSKSESQSLAKALWKNLYEMNLIILDYIVT